MGRRLLREGALSKGEDPEECASSGLHRCLDVSRRGQTEGAFGGASALSRRLCGRVTQIVDESCVMLTIQMSNGHLDLSSVALRVLEVDRKR